MANDDYTDRDAAGNAGGAAREVRIKKEGGMKAIKRKSYEEGLRAGYAIGLYNGVGLGFNLGQGKLSAEEVKAQLNNMIDRLGEGASDGNEPK